VASTQVNLCVAVTRSAASTERGHSAQWKVSAWATGGKLPDATLRLQAVPANGGAPGFTSGCGKDDGTSSCDLGALNAKSAHRQLQAQLTVPVTASTVTSASLTVTGSAANLPQDPKASATVAITAPATGTTSAPPASSAAAPLTQSTPAPVSLPVGTLPNIPAANIPAGNIPAANPALSPGGNAAGLFPTLEPQAATQSPTNGASGTSTRPLANTSALPEGATILGGQLAGLAALALAFVLAVTHLSLRRRAKGKHRAGTETEPTPPPGPEKDPAEKGDGTPPADKEAGQE
jgi:hypothetical protein